MQSRAISCDLRHQQIVARAHDLAAHTRMAECCMAECCRAGRVSGQRWSVVRLGMCACVLARFVCECAGVPRPSRHKGEIPHPGLSRDGERWGDVGRSSASAEARHDFIHWQPESECDLAAGGADAVEQRPGRRRRELELNAALACSPTPLLMPKEGQKSRRGRGRPRRAARRRALRSGSRSGEGATRALRAPRRGRALRRGSRARRGPPRPTA